MKRKIKGLISIILCIVLISPNISVNGATKIRINKKSVTIYVGKTVQLKITGTKKKVKWKSSNKAVSTVTSKGKVKGLMEGTSKITATVGKKKYTCKVTVKEKVNNVNNSPETLTPITPSTTYQPLISGNIQTNNTQTNTITPNNTPIITDVNIPVITDTPIATSPASIQPTTTSIVTNTIVPMPEAITSISPIPTTTSAIITIKPIPITITPSVTSMPTIPSITVTPILVITTETPTPTIIPTFTLIPTITPTVTQIVTSIPTITPMPTIIPTLIPTITPEILTPIPTITVSPIYGYIFNNYSTLKEYIIYHGKMDSSGNKCIQLVSDNDLFETIYNASDKMYVFYVSGKTTDNKYSYNLKLYISEENINTGCMEGDIDCEIFDISNDVLVQIVSDASMSLGDIMGYGKVGWFYKNTIYTPNNTLVSVGTTVLNTGYFGWRELIYDKLNLDITNFGFGDCIPYGGVPTVAPSNTPIVTPTIVPTMDATYSPTIEPIETTETPVRTVAPRSIPTQTTIVETDIKETESYYKFKINLMRLFGL